MWLGQRQAHRVMRLKRLGLFCASVIGKICLALAAHPLLLELHPSASFRALPKHLPLKRASRLGARQHVELTATGIQLQPSCCIALMLAQEDTAGSSSAMLSMPSVVTGAWQMQILHSGRLTPPIMHKCYCPLPPSFWKTQALPPCKGQLWPLLQPAKPPSPSQAREQGCQCWT